VWVFRGLRRALEQDRPDVVHVISEAWGTLPNQVVSWGRRRTASAVVVHASDRNWWHGSRPEIAAKRVLARRVLRRVDGFAGLTDRVVEVAHTAGLDPDVPTALVNNFPRQPEVFRPAGTADQRAARRRLGLPEEGVGVGFLARLAPEKGPLELLDALALPGALDGAWAAIAGAGPLEPQVRDRAARGGVAFLGALSFPDAVVDFYRAVDVFVAPSRTLGEWEDQLPRAVVEAMMTGCVVVGSDCGAIPEMIGDSGIVTAEGDAEDLAAGLRRAVRLADDQALRQRARARAVDRYSSVATAERMIDLWERARARKRTRSYG
jgi:glycosyltransferase involved in cell wall biosynthesis